MKKGLFAHEQLLLILLLLPSRQMESNTHTHTHQHFKIKRRNRYAAMLKAMVSFSRLYEGFKAVEPEMLGISSPLTSDVDSVNVQVELILEVRCSAGPALQIIAITAISQITHLFPHMSRLAQRMLVLLGSIYKIHSN